MSDDFKSDEKSSFLFEAKNNLINILNRPLQYVDQTLQYPNPFMA